MAYIFFCIPSHCWIFYHSTVGLKEEVTNATKPFYIVLLEYAVCMKHLYMLLVQIMLIFPLSLSSHGLGLSKENMFQEFTLLFLLQNPNT